MKTLPTQETLAVIAAATRIRNPEKAMAHAFTLWERAGDFLTQQAANGEWDGIAKPKAFPASLGDFLGLVVKARTPADGTKRLRDYYRNSYRKWLTGGKVRTLKDEDTEEIEQRANNEIGAWKKGGFSPAQWLSEGRKYAAWWKNHKSTQARQAAKRKKKSRESILSTI